MKKKIFAVIGVIIIAATLFGCSNKAIDVDTHSTESASQSTTAKTTKSVSSATKPTENSSAVSTTKKEENSSIKPSKAPAAKTTAKSTTQEEYDEPEYTKSATKAAAKTTTETTTKETTKATVKNVSASDVQAQVNSYIKSRGITIDSSLNSGNSGWNGRIASDQGDLNNGYTLRSCKDDVNINISEMGKDISMYCYYDGSYMYVCYM